MKLRCPVCHSSNSLESYGEDAAARECMVALFESGPMAWPLVSYLGLFRPSKRDLAWSRTLRLAREVLAIDCPPEVMSAALTETVEALRRKRDRGEVRPLKDHAYLMSVVGSVATRAEDIPKTICSGSTPRLAASGKKTTHDDTLADWAGSDAMRTEVAYGLLALLARRLGNPPPADTVDRTASLWLRELEKAGVLPHETDRVHRAFSGLLSHVRDWWPGPEKLTAELPRRRGQELLYGSGPREEDISAAENGLAEMRRKLGVDPSIPEEGDGHAKG